MLSRRGTRRTAWPSIQKPSEKESSIQGSKGDLSYKNFENNVPYSNCFSALGFGCSSLHRVTSLSCQPLRGFCSYSCCHPLFSRSTTLQGLLKKHQGDVNLMLSKFAQKSERSSIMEVLQVHPIADSAKDLFINLVIKC